MDKSHEVMEGKSRDRGMGFFSTEIKTVMNQGGKKVTWVDRKFTDRVSHSAPSAEGVQNTAGSGGPRKTSCKRILEGLLLLAQNPLRGMDLGEQQLHWEHKLKTTVAQAHVEVAVKSV